MFNLNENSTTPSEQLVLSSLYANSYNTQNEEQFLLYYKILDQNFVLAYIEDQLNQIFTGNIEKILTNLNTFNKSNKSEYDFPVCINNKECYLNISITHVIHKEYEIQIKLFT